MAYDSFSPYSAYLRATSLCLSSRYLLQVFSASTYWISRFSTFVFRLGYYLSPFSFSFILSLDHSLCLLFIQLDLTCCVLIGLFCNITTKERGFCTSFVCLVWNIYLDARLQHGFVLRKNALWMWFYFDLCYQTIRFATRDHCFIDIKATWRANHSSLNFCPDMCVPRGFCFSVIIKRSTKDRAQRHKHFQSLT